MEMSSVSILTGPLRPVLYQTIASGIAHMTQVSILTGPLRPVLWAGTQPGVLVGVFPSFARTGCGLAEIRLAACLPQRESCYFSV